MRRISPAVLISIIALVFAVTGTAIAGGYIITSTKQIKPSVRHALKGNRGPRGYQGDAGQPGAPGQFNTANVTQVRGPVATMCADSGTFQSCTIGQSTAQCPPGSVALGGGLDGLNSPPVVSTIVYDYPINGSAWEIIINNQASIPATFQTVATCATGAAARATSRSAVADRAARDLAHAVASHR